MGIALHSFLISAQRKSDRGVIDIDTYVARALASFSGWANRYCRRPPKEPSALHIRGVGTIRLGSEAKDQTAHERATDLKNTLAFDQAWVQAYQIAQRDLFATQNWESTVISDGVDMNAVHAEARDALLRNIDTCLRHTIATYKAIEMQGAAHMPFMRPDTALVKQRLRTIDLTPRRAGSEPDAVLEVWVRTSW